MSKVVLPGARCRVCLNLVQIKYTMKAPEGGQLVYLFCQCGTAFHEKDIDKKRFNGEYGKKLREGKFIPERLELFRRVYLPIIEEQIYGRESLDIGYGFRENIEEMRKRGWLAEGIDLIEDGEDFETAAFKEGMQWDLVILSHVVHSFQDPIKALRKAISLVHPGGLLFVAGPDPGILMTTGYVNFGYWGEEYRTMIPKERMILECVKAGMEENPIVNVTNFSKRFIYHNDFHLIMRKTIRD